MDSDALDFRTALRHLVACDYCELQYDASSRRGGDRFHCHCGRVITVPERSGHDAAVVRCSACGGVRLHEEAACRYCGAGFTLHEQDLHTLCPGCAARISDRARFCHYCATLIAPHESAGEPTQYACPACGQDRRLYSRALGDQRVSAMECGCCGGLWLDNVVFELLEQRFRDGAASATTFADEKCRGRGDRERDRQEPFYRRCPVCAALMHRRNYGRRSGVLIDTCKAHGIWFDLGELDTLLRWVKAGGLDKAEKWAEQNREQAAKVSRLLASIDHERRASQATTRGSGMDLISRILDFLMR